MGYLIGADIGTTGTKTLLCDEKGEVLATAMAEHHVSTPKPLWSEQDPEEWWSAACKAIKAVVARAGVDGREVKGIGLSGQMHGLVMLDNAGKVIRPAILWNDQRTAEQCHEITEKVGYARLMEFACNPALTGFTAPKILWVRKNEPRNYGRCSKILLPKDYIRYRLTGEFATDASDASGTLLFDVKNRRWSNEILEILGIDDGLLAGCYESPEITSEITREVANEFGIPAGTPVVGGAGDQAAGAVGNGIVGHGVVSATLGTSGVVFASSDDVLIDPEGRVHTFCHAVPKRWHVMGVMLSAGGAFQWARDAIGEIECEEAKREGRDPYELMTEKAEEAVVGCEGLIFLPYLTGERTPHANPNARGAWIGLTPRHGKNELFRSVMEGITFGMRDSLEIIKKMGLEVGEIRLSGGGAKSRFWRQMQADVYGQKTCTINAEEGPAYGAALLAGVGIGNWKSVEDACAACVSVREHFNPIEENRKIYDEFYPVYRSLYRSLEKDFDSITKTVQVSSQS